jgi:hypothetical protein
MQATKDTTAIRQTTSRNLGNVEWLIDPSHANSLWKTQSKSTLVYTDGIDGIHISGVSELTHRDT